MQNFIKTRIYMIRKIIKFNYARNYAFLHKKCKNNVFFNRLYQKWICLTRTINKNYLCNSRKKKLQKQTSLTTFNIFGWIFFSWFSHDFEHIYRLFCQDSQNRASYDTRPTKMWTLHEYGLHIRILREKLCKIPKFYNFI